jgi:hypothetical protein
VLTNSSLPSCYRGQERRGSPCLTIPSVFLLVADLFTKDIELTQRHTAAPCAPSRLSSRASSRAQRFDRGPKWLIELYCGAAAELDIISAIGRL